MEPLVKESTSAWSLVIAGREPGDQDDSDIKEPFEKSLTGKVSALARVLASEASR